MMCRWSAVPLIFLFSASYVCAASKKIAEARGQNEDLILTVTLHLDPADIKQLVTSDLDGHYFVAEVKVEPKYGKTIAIDRDDFVLRTDKDGSKVTPFAGSQIAGTGALIITEVKQPAASPGMVGIGGVMVGGGGAGATSPSVKTTEHNGAQDKENPLKKVLDQKILPEGKTDQPVSGLLYFPMEKQKMKDLELDYGGKENRISLRFK